MILVLHFVNVEDKMPYLATIPNRGTTANTTTTTTTITTTNITTTNTTTTISCIAKQQQLFQEILMTLLMKKVSVENPGFYN